MCRRPMKMQQTGKNDSQPDRKFKQNESGALALSPKFDGLQYKWHQWKSLATGAAHSISTIWRKKFGQMEKQLLINRLSLDAAECQISIFENHR